MNRRSVRVVAPTYLHAKAFAEDRGVRQWKYVGSPWMLAGVRNAEVLVHPATAVTVELARRIWEATRSTRRSAALKRRRDNATRATR